MCKQCSAGQINVVSFVESAESEMAALIGRMITNQKKIFSPRFHNFFIVIDVSETKRAEIEFFQDLDRNPTEQAEAEKELNIDYVLAKLFTKNFYMKSLSLLMKCFILDFLKKL